MRSGEGIRIRGLNMDSSMAKAYLEELFEENKLCPKCKGMGEVCKVTEEELQSICQLYYSSVPEVKKMFEASKKYPVMNFSAVLRRLLLKRSGKLRRCKKCKGKGYMER